MPGLAVEGWRGGIPAFTSLSYVERQVPIPEIILPVPLQCFHVPYSALTMFISREQSERDSATAYRKSISFPFSPWLGAASAQLLCCSSGWGVILLQMPCWKGSLDHFSPQGWCVMNIIQG